MTKKHTLTLQAIILYHMSWHTNGLVTLSHVVIGSIFGSTKDLQRFANGNAETDDLRKVFELETGQSLQQFFDQWIFREGHPELKVEFYHDNHIVEIKIKQSQTGEPFEFPLEIEMAFANSHK